MIFLFSSFLQLPKHYFEGYAFVDADYISGMGGAQAYLAETGRFIPPGEDGCYLSIQEIGEAHRIGVDFCGNKKIFYYWDGKNWGISNSVVELARHLSANGIALHANRAQLESLKISSTLTSQVSCFTTLVHGIRLLPTYCELLISPSGFHIKTRLIKPILDYKEALGEFTNIWVRRFETLVVNPALSISCDLTGGRDSRVVFSFLQRARKRLGKDVNAEVTVRSGTTARWAADYEAANRIADHYGIKLNKKPSKRSASEEIRRTPEEIYNSWFKLNVGVYFSVYFPPSSKNDFAIHLHGAGGGNHRVFYPWNDPDEFLREYASQIAASRELQSWADEFRSTYMMLISRMPDVPYSMLHYREFRNRMHGGRAPQYRVALSPLAGQHMENLSNHQEKAINMQVYFDTMESLLPGIMDFPYDDAEKAPTKVNRKNLTLVQVDTKAAPGKAYVVSSEKSTSAEVKKVGQETPFMYMIKDFQETNVSEVKYLLPQVYMAAQHAIEKAAKSGKFDHASHGKMVSRVFAARFALNYI